MYCVVEEGLIHLSFRAKLTMTLNHVKKIYIHIYDYIMTYVNTMQLIINNTHFFDCDYQYLDKNLKTNLQT